MRLIKEIRFKIATAGKIVKKDEIFLGTGRKVFWGRGKIGGILHIEILDSRVSGVLASFLIHIE